MGIPNLDSALRAVLQRTAERLSFPESELEVIGALRVRVSKVQDAVIGGHPAVLELQLSELAADALTALATSQAQTLRRLKT